MRWWWWWTGRAGQLHRSGGGGVDRWTYTALDIVAERGLLVHGLWVIERNWWLEEEMRWLRLSKGGSWVDQEC